VTRKRALNAAFVLAALVVAGLAAHHFAGTGWPLHRANPWLVLLAAAIFLASYAAKAWGWQRLFRLDQRPAMLSLAAAGGAAAVGGIALPGRFDEVLRIAVVRRCRRRRASIGAVALSLFLLGLLDSVALTPFASAAAALGGIGGWLEAGMIVVAVAGVAAAGVVLGLPRLARRRRVARFRVAGWVAEHATAPRQAVYAWVGVALSWSLRAVGIFVLLAALGLGTDFSLALAFLCGSAASAVLPVAPAGAATQVGAGAAILVASGVHAEQAVAFGIAAQGLAIGVGAGFVLAMAAWHFAPRAAASRQRVGRFLQA
jgi:uncharacterized membrane protein YbhN (UPF0104 family)